MTREEAIAELRVCQVSDNTEQDHWDADEILCKLLISLGYKDVVSEYEKVDKWFA